MNSKTPTYFCWVLILGSTACAGAPPTDPEEPVHLVPLRGDEQIRFPGSTLIDPLTVQAVSGDGQEIARSGISISWEVIAGNGAISPFSDTTDAGGRASARWTLGPLLETQSAEAATLEGRTAQFTARAADAGSIAFESEAIFVMNEDGSDVIHLTRPPAQHRDQAPLWSHDGSRLVFVRSGDNGANAYVTDATGANEQMLASFPGASVVSAIWSPDDSQLAVSVQPNEIADSCRYANVYLVEIDSGVDIPLVAGCTTPGFRVTDWKEDAPELLLERKPEPGSERAENHIYTMTLADTSLDRKTFGYRIGNMGGRWCPGNSRFAFSRNEDAGLNTYKSEIRTMAQDGYDQSVELDYSELSGDDRLFVSRLDWSPDGRHIVFSGFTPSMMMHLFILDVATGETTPIRSPEGITIIGRDPAWRR